MNELEMWLPKLELYAKELSTLDDRIYEIVLIGGLVNENFHSLSDIDLVCLFDPELNDGSEGHMVIDALYKPMKKRQIELKIHHPIDLGFMIGSAIYLGGTIKTWGVITNYKGLHWTLYRTETSSNDDCHSRFRKRVEKLCEFCEVPWLCKVCRRCKEHCDCFRL